MAVWNDLEPGHEDEFDAWYQRQHLLERLGVPGFREARRYRAEVGSPRYCALYWLDHVGILGTAAYRERLAHPTRWTRRMMPRFRAMARTPAEVALDAGYGIGGCMAWIACMDLRSNVTALQAALGPAFLRCLDHPDLVRLQLWLGDPDVSGLANPEAHLRPGADRVARWIVCMEAADPRALAASRATLHAAIAAAAASDDLMQSPVYRLTRQVLAEQAPPPCSDEAAGVTWTA